MTRLGEWRRAVGLLGVLLAGIAGVSGCNTRTPIHDAVIVTAPSGFANAAVPAGPGGDLAKVELSPPATIGGGSGAGVVFLDGPAEEGGLAVSMESSASSTVRVTPSVVTIPAGSVSAAFSYATTSLQRDADVSITASTPARSRSARVSVWAAGLSSFFHYLAERIDVNQPFTTDRVTSDMNANFSASCSGNVVSANAAPDRGASRSLRFAAAGSQALRPGVYDRAMPNGSGNHMRLEFLRACLPVGRFEVHDIEMFANGDVTRLWVTFEAVCAGGDGTVRGEYRRTNMTRSTSRVSTCVGGK
jgi:hypothetical protein